MRWARYGLIVGQLFALGACGDGELGLTAEPSVTETIVTGQTSPTSQDQQAESAFSVQTIPCGVTCPPATVTVASNDRTTETEPGTNCPTGPNGVCIVYTSTSRDIYPNASLLGVSVSTNGGGSYGWAGKVRPPPGWKFLWGDPAITLGRRNHHYVYIANLAAPADKFPPSGHVHDDDTTYGAGILGALGGGCVARSTDYGRTFSLTDSADCLSVGSPKHIFDGSSMESDLSGNVYVAFDDIGILNQPGTATVVVFQAPSETAHFALMPAQPFPGMAIHGHPRLRFDSISGRLYLLAQGDPGAPVAPGVQSPDSFETLWLTYWDGASWSPPTPVAPDVLENPDIRRGFPTLVLRTGPQYSFDIGTPSVNNDDDIRITYTSRDSDGLYYSRRYLKTVRCTRDPAPVCNDSPEWSTRTLFQGDQFNPVTRAQPYFWNVPAVWRISYHSTSDALEYGSNVLSTYFAGLGVNGSGGRFLAAGLLAYNRPLCQTLGGYWGDYDDLQVLNVNGTTGITTFLRVLSDSRPSCNYQWQYDAKPIHLTSFSFQ